MKINLLRIILISFVFTAPIYAAIGSDVSVEGALPVELTSFEAKATDFTIVLNWSTATEVDNYGFEIERALSRQVGTTPRQDEWENIGFVRGHGNSNSPKNYSFVDDEPLAGKILYRLKQIDTDGGFEYSSIIEIRFGSVPEKFILMQNYPNPFGKNSVIGNSTTVIEYSIPKTESETDRRVQLNVFDLLGKKVATLVNKRQPAGNYRINFNAERLSAGIYFYTIETADFAAAKKMIIIR